MLAEKIRIRYHEGMESSCLMNKKVHKIEDCLKCPLFQVYQKKWRRVLRFPVPVLDPIILRLSGYCPFHVLYSPVFWRNSFVIVHYKLLPIVGSVLSRLRLKKVFVYFDEYLEIIKKAQITYTYIDVKKFDGEVSDLSVIYNNRRYRLGDIIDMYNRLLDFMWSKYVEACERVSEKIVLSRGIRNLLELYAVFREYLDKVFSREISIDVLSVKSIKEKVRELIGVLDVFYSKYKIPVLRRLVRNLRFWYTSLFRVEYDGYSYSVVFDPEFSITRSGKLAVASSVGGYVFSFIKHLYDQGKEVGIVFFPALLLFVSNTVIASSGSISVMYLLPDSLTRALRFSISSCFLAVGSLTFLPASSQYTLYKVCSVALLLT